MKMKGVMKGLKYISNIFENEKKPEFEIGHPTDVKHVAHIGHDGQSGNKPSWMDDYESTKPPSGASTNHDEADPVTKRTAVAVGAPLECGTGRISAKQKKPKRNTSSIGMDGSPGPDSSATNNKTRKFKNSGSNYDSTTRDSGRLSIGSDPTGQDSALVAKRSSRKKTKASSSSGSGSGRTSRSKGQDSSSKHRPSSVSADGSEHGPRISTNDPNSVLGIYEQ